MLQATPPHTHETLLTPLINDLVSVPSPFILVLDDYHLVTALAAPADRLPLGASAAPDASGDRDA